MVAAWVPALDCVAEPPQVPGPSGSTSFRGGPEVPAAAPASEAGPRLSARAARAAGGGLDGLRRPAVHGHRGVAPAPAPASAARGGAAGRRGGGVTGRRGAGQAAEPDGVLPSRGVERGRAPEPLLPPRRARHQEWLKGRRALPPARLPPRVRPPLGSLSAPRPAPRAPCVGPGVRSAPRGRPCGLGLPPPPPPPFTVGPNLVPTVHTLP
jgi:hypothetical protein